MAGRAVGACAVAAMTLLATPGQASATPASTDAQVISGEAFLSNGTIEAGSKANGSFGTVRRARCSGAATHRSMRSADTRSKRSEAITHSPASDGWQSAPQQTDELARLPSAFWPAFAWRRRRAST
jgi:hypothetical protein